MKQGTILARLGLSALGLLAWHCYQEKRAAGTQRRCCLPLALSYQNQRPPTNTLNLPKKLALTQYSPHRLRMTAQLTAAICFEVSSQVLPLSLWVEHQAAQVHNSAVVRVRCCSHTWLSEGGFMCTFILVHVGRHEEAEFAFSFWSLCIYYPFVRSKLFCISNVRKAPTSPFQDDYKTRHPVKLFHSLILRFFNQAEWNSFVLLLWEKMSN